MTIPLMVLAFFSVVAGYVSWPKAWAGTERFDRYLAPVFGRSEQVLTLEAARHAEGLTPGMLLTFSIVAAGLGIALAFWLYIRSTQIPARLAEQFSAVYRVLTRKYYVDEFYDWLIVRPLRVGSEIFLWRFLDVGVIDRIGVEGTGHVTAGVGSILRRIQSGNLRSYAAWILLGAVIWLAFFLLGS
jgi:NADH-quinone oxidoreductase subunit L